MSSFILFYVEIKLSYNHLLKKTILFPLYKVITLLKINCPYMHTCGNELSISFHLFTCLSLYQYNIVLIIVFLKQLPIPIEQVFLPCSSSVVSAVLGSFHFSTFSSNLVTNVRNIHIQVVIFIWISFNP